ncbi:hypothetical protein Tco_1231840, partial [Tanacetum coccineum]
MINVFRCGGGYDEDAEVKELQASFPTFSGENVPEKEVMKKVLDKTPAVGKENEEYEESDL